MQVRSVALALQVRVLRSVYPLAIGSSPFGGLNREELASLPFRACAFCGRNVEAGDGYEHEELLFCCFEHRQYHLTGLFTGYSLVEPEGEPELGDAPEQHVADRGDADDEVQMVDPSAAVRTAAASSSDAPAVEQEEVNRPGVFLAERGRRYKGMKYDEFEVEDMPTAPVSMRHRRESYPSRPGIGMFAETTDDGAIASLPRDVGAVPVQPQ